MKKTIRYIGYILRDCRRAFPVFFAMNLGVDAVRAATAVMQPLLLARILELAGGAPAAEEGRLAGAIALYGLCLVCGPVADAMFRSGSKNARVRAEKYFGNQMTAFSAKIRLEALENPETLDKFGRANASMTNQIEFFEQMLFLSRSAVTCIGLMAVVGRYSPVLVFTGLFALCPGLLSKIYFEKRLTAFRRSQSSVLRRSAYLRGLFSRKESVREMRVMGFGEYLTDKWKETNAERARDYRKMNLDISKKQVWGIIVLNLCYAFNIGLSFYLMAAGRISMGAFAACLSAFTAYDGALGNLIAIMFGIVHTYHIAEDYYDYFTIPTEEDGTEQYRPFQNRISVRNVRFRYSGSSEEALRGLDCEIKKGEHVVIVGENGSGKTTFSKLLTGVYLPAEGEVLYDGQRTDRLCRKSLYRHISAVQQKFVRYRFSLRENIGISDVARMGDTAAMEQLLRRVAGEDFLKRVGGLDVQLGREFNGLELSGGEWQKVAIARGLWKDSDIVVLDEPTSALDPLVEYDILSKFAEMIRGKTSVIISHRVGICRAADRIIVMKEGRVAECGKHQELLQTGGEYARIWREQAKWYE
ncbi:MAG: ABC transporter ATP-binding protein [Lachnospiraceae bacterium]|nr:ABC transporter ATP-binding protein [Lachnospiraceae bacterium]